MADTKKEFGKMRSFFWPIYNFELKKVIPMLFLFFLILFNYTILRDTKDVLIVAGTTAGAEIIPFLKLWGVLPFAIIFMFIYAKLSNVLSKKALFYAAVLPFLIFFALFATVIYPNQEALTPIAFTNYLTNTLPNGFNGFIGIIHYWPSSLFYIMSELWGSVCLSLLFWGFANDITRVNESKRFYNLFGLGANFSLIVAGAYIKWASKSLVAGAGANAWQMSLNYLISMVIISGLLIMGIYWWINKYVLTDPKFYNQSEVKLKKKKPKLSMKESFKMILSSKYLGCIALLVIGYGICINLVEVTWKSQLKLAYPSANEYSAFMGGFSQMTGIATIFMMFFVTGNVVRKLGWKFAALITPVVLLITGVAFFSFIVFREGLTGFISMMGTTPLMLAVIFGTAQNIMSKSAKYSLFDPTKEMAYIPLDQESKVKGKAAIDVVGARLGKSGGALIQSFFILTVGSLTASLPYIGIILMVIIGLWILAASSLSKQFKTANDDMEKASKKAVAATDHA
jgi:ATP:ADP antiporter, AAA family